MVKVNTILATESKKNQEVYRLLQVLSETSRFSKHTKLVHV